VFQLLEQNLLVIHKCSGEQDARETFTSLWLYRLSAVCLSINSLQSSHPRYRQLGLAADDALWFTT